MTFGLVPLNVEGSGYRPPGVHDFHWGSVWPGVLPDWVNKPFLQLVIGGLLVILFWVLGSRSLKVQPSKKQTFFEVCYEFIRNSIARDILHSDFRKFLPYLLALFTLLLFNNWFGEFFYFMYPTFSNAGFVYGVAFVSWVVYMGAGFKRHGLHFVKLSALPPGVPIFLVPLVAVLEILSNWITRVVTLALRLFANMFAGHLVVMVFVLGGSYLIRYEGNIFYNVSGVVSFAFSLIILLLELFIGALQAYIFTVLTAQYVSTSLSEAH